MRVILVGAGGKMGKTISEMENENFKIVAKIDLYGDFLHSIGEYKGQADVIFDFSSSKATDDVLSYAVDKKIPLVLGSTGQTKKEIAKIKRASKVVPIFFSANTSVGIAALGVVAKKVMGIFGKNSQVEILEVHHKDKTDSPSGTALMLAKYLGAKKPTYARRGARKPDEIGISSLRYGNVFGRHEIIISNGEQTITLTHDCSSRKVFAEGAFRAGEFILSKRCGLYDVFDLIDET
ncbi:MAG: 4-hydroxy-tetrahydrodipicolinate reductase [Clostridia bacterium]|nr:4-hydroxy-tetrahydrodipicolinate reductase [Clostridia bacterium]